MKKNKKMIIGIGLLIFVLLISLGLIFYRKDCFPKDNTYTIFMKSKTFDDLGSMEVCVDCDNNTYKKLPTLNMNGYTFLGWYYDRAFTKPAPEAILELEIKPIHGKFGCITSYEDIEVYAKFEKEK